MPKVATRTKKITFVISVILATAIIGVSQLRLWEILKFDEYVFFALIAAMSPTAVLGYVEYRWRKAVNERLPDLFRAIVQSQETGMTLPQAIENAAKRNYGPLTPELRKMTSQISWGMTFEEAILALGRRVNTVLVQRTVPLIIEASRSGGHVEKVFDPMGRFVQSTLLLDKARKNQTRPYVAVIYVAFFVFIFTIILLFQSFFVSVEGLPILGAGSIPGEQMRRVFFHMTCVQALFGGLVAGKMGEGTISAGLKHSLIMMLLGYAALKIFVGV